jgi:stage II sporulation protein D
MIALATGVAVVTAGATLSCVMSTDGERPELWQVPQTLDAAPAVRVALERGVKSVRVAVEGPYRLIGDDGEVVSQGDRLAEVEVRPAEGGLALGRYIFRPAWLKVLPSEAGTLRVDGRAYRGELIVADRGSGDLLVLNRLGLESYVAGVVGNEMPLSWPMAALRAQAIAARTYALQRLQARKRSAWDVTDDASSQVYKGLENETERARAVVTDTLGVILSWQGRVLTAFYHSTCGGDTIPAAWVFGGADLPPLRGGPCGFCESSKYYRWELRLSPDDLAAKLKGRGAVAPVTSVAVTETGPADHVGKVEIAHAGGTLAISGADLRRSVGHSRIRATRFRAGIEGGEVVFTGAGWGHAVGMCQVGARGMADAGYGTRDILGRYYPGAELVTLYERPE